ncbi:MAG: cobalamin-independent methionine synthase II family protein [Actinobacteria bacterium]|nr:cobalamin-independent methionine synthase II family protein [Actinomycetota bacterium]
MSEGRFERILTTHTGSLPRPDDLARMVLQRDDGQQVGGFEERLRIAIEQIVERQVDAGVDIVSDGEQGKISYVTYIKDRLIGFEGEPSVMPGVRTQDEHPDYSEKFASQVANTAYVRPRPACVGPIRYRGLDETRRDIANLRAAAETVAADQAFMTAPSPALVAGCFENRYYSTEEEYVTAIGDAMGVEYRAICNAGITLQLDCPDIGGGASIHSSADQRRRVVARNIEVLNQALGDLPAERMRMHVCWGNYDGPHEQDVELGEIVDLVLTARPAGLSVEASNPRHAHEWEVFEDVRLPDGKYLIPGVVESTNNFVEHPRVVAQRIMRYARLVGPERVVAGSDCGFGTWLGSVRVAPSVVWSKLRAMAEGARIATQELTSRTARGLPGGDPWSPPSA